MGCIWFSILMKDNFTVTVYYAKFESWLIRLIDIYLIGQGGETSFIIQTYINHACMVIMYTVRYLDDNLK